ncbi:MAG: type IV conjugative transfer system protein TraE [Gammaproteobacteria bacterium]
MQHLLYEQLQQQKKQQLNRYRVLLLSLALLIMLLLLMVFKLIGNERTILLPMQGEGSYWIDQTAVSEAYLQQISEQLLWLRLNIHPDNAKRQQQQFLSFVHPQYYPDLKQQFTQEIETIEQQQIILNFYPKMMTVDSERLQVEVQGQLQIQVALGEIISQDSHYQMQYELKQGRLWVVRFERLTGDDND